MANSYQVGDKIKTQKAFKSPGGNLVLPKGTKGVVTWADGDKYIVKLETNASSGISLQVTGREILKRGLFSGN